MPGLQQQGGENDLLPSRGDAHLAFGTLDLKWPENSKGGIPSVLDKCFIADDGPL